MRVTIELLNEMNKDEFLRIVGPVFEHSPWVAERVWDFRPFRSVAQLHGEMMSRVREAGEPAVLQLFRAHPDLATRLKVTELSAGEQGGAGLDRLSPQEYERFSELNRRYKQKFGFPFILAVAGKTKEQIAEAMERRLQHEAAEEWRRALSEIAKITEIRLERIIQSTAH
ncbi:2-oxo-4-hydroxy-4-carboxy-5-ureidoimidazoline decarboxylase [Paenibacillus chartarius]|uniref:2-oxo-4-hydroxy-4-carboxy-5-ureidoimidazoline decarboxylase n=1 Tax=Paenibacillus chartarius TaxID=747481 RepID=A0ABV6DH25_9BACL